MGGGGGGVIKDPLERKVLGVRSANQRVFCVRGMDIFWNHTIVIIFIALS